MKNELLFIDAICIFLFSVHLTDLDLLLKVLASATIITVNTIAIYKKIKTKK